MVPNFENFAFSDSLLAFITGDLSNLTDEETVHVLDILSLTGNAGPNETFSNFLEHTTLGQGLDFISSVNPAQNIYETGAASAGAAISLYANRNRLAETLENLRSLGLQDGIDNPWEIRGFRAASERAMNLGMKIERSLKGLAKNAGLALLRKIPGINRSTIQKLDGHLSNIAGAEGELAFDLVFSSLADANGGGLFREVTDRFKMGRQGIDRTIITNDGQYIDFEIKAARQKGWPTLSSDQKKGGAWFVPDRLERISQSSNHPAHLEADDRLAEIRRGSNPVTAYAYIGRKVYSQDHKIEFQLRPWDTKVGWQNSTRTRRGFSSGF